jgi:mannose/cellobiose epimerase-like protein (N-acyl-D-glucosamine 2-epimerase family)
MFDNHRLVVKPTTSHNPQADAINEQVNKLVNDTFRLFDKEKEKLDEDNPFDYFLQSIAHKSIIEAPMIYEYIKHKVSANLFLAEI